jgi:hypothetical protein
VGRGYGYAVRMLDAKEMEGKDGGCGVGENDEG